MALLTTQNVTTTGLATSLTAASGGGDTYVPATGRWVEINNGSGGSITVTMVTPGVVDGTLAIADRTITVNAGTVEKIAAPPALYTDPTTGLGTINYSSATSVTVGVFQI